MIILDAYAVLAYLRGEPCAGQVAGLLREPTGLTAVNAAEVVDQLLAGRLRARHYERNTTAVSLADCIAAATALTRAHPLATADPALATVIRQEGEPCMPSPTAGADYRRHR